MLCRSGESSLKIRKPLPRDFGGMLHFKQARRVFAFEMRKACHKEDPPLTVNDEHRQCWRHCRRGLLIFKETRI